ncbi:MAG: DNA polymerase, partial [Candidatus Thorarchaeota archaeon]
MLNYGMKEKNLAGRLGCTEEEAKEKMEQYMDRYPAVRRFFQMAVEIARETNHAFTYLGRRRILPDIHSYKNDARWNAERIASNVPIQGCLPASTKILTNFGYIPIGDAPIKGTVWTGTRWAEYDLLDRGRCELAELELSNGQVLTCDTRHELLVLEEGEYRFKKWVELEEEDDVCLSLAVPLEFGRRMAGTEHFYWMGFATGNGHTSNRSGHLNALSMTFGDRKDRYKFQEKAEEFKTYAREYLNVEPQAPQEYENKITVVVENKSIRQYWEHLGYCWGHTAESKRVPTSVWTATLGERKAYLLGMLDADGNVGVKSRNNPNIHLCQKELLQEIQILLRTVGVESIVRSFKSGSHRLDMNGSQLVEHLKYGSTEMAAKIPGMRASAEVTGLIMSTDFSTPSHQTIK